MGIVVPVYCSGNYLREFHESLLSFLEGYTENWEIIYVDDHSTDSSWALLEEFAYESKNCKIIRLKENVGQQMATFCALRHTTSDYVVTIDDDGQYCPEYISDLYEKMRQESLDCVYGIPLIRSRRIIRRLGTWITDRSLTRITGKSTQLKVSSFRIMSRSLVERLRTCTSGRIYLSVEILSRANSIGNFPMTLKHEERASRYTLRRLLNAYLSVHRHQSSQISHRPRYVIEVSRNIDEELV